MSPPLPLDRLTEAREGSTVALAKLGGKKVALLSDEDGIHMTQTMKNLKGKGLAESELDSIAARWERPRPSLQRTKRP